MRKKQPNTIQGAWLCSARGGFRRPGRRLSTILLLALSAAFGAGCAKIADPQPPEIRIPKPAVDLAARQVSDSIVLTFSKPVQNTDGSPATTLASVEVFRLVEDGSRNIGGSPLPEDQFVRQAVRIRSIAPAGFPGLLQGDSFVITDKPSLPDKSSIYAHAFRYAVLFINRKNQMAGFSNQAYVAPVAIPLPPSGITATMTEDSIRLSWAAPTENMDGSGPPRVAGYDVCRSSDPQKMPAAPVNPSPLSTPSFEDRDFQFGRTYYYAVRTVGSIQNPYAVSLLSDALQVEARDAFPPAPPENFNAILDGSDVVLLWAPSQSPDVAGYRVYRRDKKAGTTVLLQKDLITGLSFRDRHVETDVQYEYSIQAVDAHGNDSAPVRAEASIR
jgi:hypothetical protein